MTDARLLELDYLGGNLTATEAAELIAEVRRCHQQVAELQAANSVEVERRRLAEWGVAVAETSIMYSKEEVAAMLQLRVEIPTV